MRPGPCRLPCSDGLFWEDEGPDSELSCFWHDGLSDGYLKKRSIRLTVSQGSYVVTLKTFVSSGF